jgi:hypothetical protein
MKTAVLPLLLLAGAAAPAGCKPTPEGPSCGAIRGLLPTRTVEHAGGGREITVRVDFADGAPGGPSDLSPCLVAQAAAGAVRVAARPVQRAYTLLLVDPGSNRAELESARALVDALARVGPTGAGDGDQLAVYRWGPEVTQVAPFLSDHRLLFERLQLMPARSGPAAPVGDALVAASRALSAIGGNATDALRTIIMVAPSPMAVTGLGAALENARPHLVAWIGFSDHPELAASVPAGLRFRAQSTDLQAAAEGLRERLESLRRHAHYAVGLCGDPAQSRLTVGVRGAPMPASLDLDLLPMLDENRAGSCQPEELAAGRRRFPDRLELVFSEEQRAAAEAAFRDRAAQPTFPLSVRVAEGVPATPATAHYRGGGSYSCQRRNFSVNLQGKTPRFFFPGFGASKFHLVAMCLDRLYLRNFTALQMLAAEGLMPIPFEMVELFIDGKSQGPYLVIENVSDSLAVHHSGVTAVVRRNSAPGGNGTLPEVRWSAADDASALASYAGILAAADGLSGQALAAAFADRFDLEGYFTWVALMNLIGSGDYVDEVYFYALETTSAAGQRTDYHRIMGWDQDDLFAGCHYSGRFALHDPNRLVDCAEAELDRRLFADPHLYRRYADVLAAVIERHPPERFADFLANTTRRLESFFARPEALAALVELRRLNSDAPASPELARTLLASERELLAVQFEQTRTELQRRLRQLRP